MTSQKTRRWAKDALGAVLLFVAYFVTARLGLLMDAVAGFATLVWPPTGIALAALVLFGARLWPGVLVGAQDTSGLTAVDRAFRPSGDRALGGRRTKDHPMGDAPRPPPSTTATDITWSLRLVRATSLRTIAS